MKLDFDENESKEIQKLPPVYENENSNKDSKPEINEKYPGKIQ